MQHPEHVNLHSAWAVYDYVIIPSRISSLWYKIGPVSGVCVCMHLCPSVCHVSTLKAEAEAEPFDVWTQKLVEGWIVMSYDIM